MRQVVIYPDPESNSWIAEVPGLPGCITDGATKEEVLQNAREAIECWLEGAAAVGMHIPSETFDVQVCVV